MNIIKGLTFVPHANAINVAAMTDITRAALNLDSDMVEVADGTPIQRVQSTIDVALRPLITSQCGGDGEGR